MDLTLDVLRLVVALGLFNVWLVRSRSATAYRGGDAQSLAEEFQAYGLPPWMLYLVGALKLSAAFALIAGFWFEDVVLPAAAVVSVLMFGALAMHVRVKDAALKSLPAALMLLMNVGIVALTLG